MLPVAVHVAACRPQSPAHHHGSDRVAACSTAHPCIGAGVLAGEQASKQAGRRHMRAPSRQQKNSCEARRAAHRAWVQGGHSRGAACHRAAAGRRAWAAAGAGRRRGAGRRHRGRAGGAGSHRAGDGAGTAASKGEGQRVKAADARRAHNGVRRGQGGAPPASSPPPSGHTCSAPVRGGSPAVGDSQAGSQEEGSRRGCAPGCPGCLGSAHTIHTQTVFQRLLLSAAAGGGMAARRCCSASQGGLSPSTTARAGCGAGQGQAG